MSAALISVLVALILSTGTVVAAIVAASKRSDRKAEEITILVNGQLRDAIARISELSRQLGHEQGPPGTPPVTHV